MGMVDATGFEDLKSGNSLEQLCINLADEQTNHVFNRFFRRLEREEDMREGVDVSPDDSEDGSDLEAGRSVLELVLGRPEGILAILDQETKKEVSKDGDRLLSSRLHSQLGGKGCYEAPRASDITQFKIRHFAYDVTYDSEGFLEKNRNFLSPAVIQVMRE